MVDENEPNDQSRPKVKNCFTDGPTAQPAVPNNDAVDNVAVEPRSSDTITAAEVDGLDESNFQDAQSEAVSTGEYLTERAVGDSATVIVDGSLGAQGGQGGQGGQGAQEAHGIQRSQSAQGGQGAQGPHGIQRSQSAICTQGAQGAHGSQRGQSAQRSQSAQGTQVAQVAQGAHGAHGAQGVQVAQGAAIIRRNAFRQYPFETYPLNNPELMRLTFWTSLFTPEAWFQPRRLHRRVEEILYWHNKTQSCVFMAEFVLLLLALKRVSLVSLIAQVSLTFLVIALACRLWHPREHHQNISGENLRHNEDCVVNFVSPELIQWICNNVSERINQTLTKLRDVYLVKDIYNSVVFGFGLFAFAILGSLMDLATIFVVLVLFMFLAPKFYESYKEDIDEIIVGVRRNHATIKRWIPLIRVETRRRNTH